MNVLPLHPPRLDANLVRGAIINSASAAILKEAPLSVIDPRGMIFDRSPSGTHTLRVRGDDTSHVLVLASGSDALGDSEMTRWEVVPLTEDLDLPGSALLRDGAAGLRALVGLPGTLTCSVITHRLGRRAVLRVSAAEGQRQCYVKLLSRKAYGKASAVFSSLARAEADFVLQPGRTDEESAALVFDEVAGMSAHDRLWAGDTINLRDLLSGISAFASLPSQLATRFRDLESERASALRALGAAETFLEDLGRLREAVSGLSLPELPGSVLIHGDLHDKQIFLHGRSVRFIDAEGLARGNGLIDIVNLAEHFRLRGHQGCARGPAVTAVLEVEAGLDLNDPATRALRALTRARLAGVYGSRPWYWGVATTLAGEATALLEESW